MASDLTRIKCPKCQIVIKVDASEGPVDFECPGCGRKGRHPGKKKDPEVSESGAYRKKILCPQCRTEIIVTSQERPLEIECPKCHKTGLLKGESKPFKWPWQK